MSTKTQDNPTTARVDRGQETSSSRLFFVGMALLLMVIVFAGFWPTYFGPLLSDEAPGHPQGMLETSWIMHLHGTIFLAWLVILLSQATLISQGRTRTHMRLGRLGVGLGVVVFLVGLLVTFQQMRRFVSEGLATWAETPVAAWRSLTTIAQFAILLGLGYAYRMRPPAHKRYMIFATIALVQAATSRMAYLLGPWSMEIMFVVMVGPIFAYDCYHKSRIRLATMVGTGVLLLFFVLRPLLE